MTTPFFKERVKTKKQFLTILLLTMFIASSMLVFPVHSTPDVTTTAYLDFAPDPIGVGQTLVIIGWIDPEPPTGYYYTGLELNITNPAGGWAIMGPYTSDSQGAIWVTYTPSIVGEYSVELFCPEQTLGEETYSNSSVVESFTVQPEPGDPTYVPEGEDVEVFPDPEVGLVFELVTEEGSVEVDKSMTGPPCAGESTLERSLIGPYYYITTTAEFQGDLTLRIFYDDAGLTLEQEQALRMIQTDIILGDVNLDGIVNWRDIIAIARALGSYPGHRRWNPSCDLNKDNKVDICDLRIALKNFGRKSQWTDITDSVDTVNNIIIGITDRLDQLDPFGVRRR